MSTAEAVITILSLVSLALIWGIYAWAYRKYRIDLFRQRLFAIRDELFDLARAGEIEFEDPAYRMLRNLLNGYIRFAHRLNFQTAFLVLVSSKSRQIAAGIGRKFEDRWSELTEELPDAVEEDLRNLRKRVEIEVAKHVVFTSAILTLTLVPVVLVMILTAVYDQLSERTKRLLRSWGGDLDTIAINIGSSPPRSSAGGT